MSATFDPPRRSLLNPHVLFERVLLAIGRRFVVRGRLYFSKVNDSPTFEEHLAAVEFNPPPITGLGLYEVPTQSLAGAMDPAFAVTTWCGVEAPTIVYIHGASMVPFDGNFKKFFPARDPVEANLVVIRMPCHRTQDDFWEVITDMNRYVAMMATTAALAEHLLSSSKLRITPFRLLAGYSLGGFITNRHHLIHNTADVYLPFITGTMQGEIYLNAVRDDVAPCDPARLRTIFNFDKAWAAALRTHHNVFPLLALYDTINLYEEQGPSYAGIDIEVWKAGHLTSMMQSRRVREKFLRHLPEG